MSNGEMIDIIQRLADRVATLEKKMEYLEGFVEGLVQRQEAAERILRDHIQATIHVLLKNLTSSSSEKEEL